MGIKWYFDHQQQIIAHSRLAGILKNE